ncbi:MAG TPA: hypothetical protein VFE59_04215 [Trebonia sp.]|nr:hypothetical protein [Trebonia sp.]
MLPGRDGRWVGGVRGGLEMEATVSATLRLVREGIGMELWRGRWPRFVASLVKPDLAISLRRE